MLAVMILVLFACTSRAGESSSQVLRDRWSYAAYKSRIVNRPSIPKSIHIRLRYKPYVPYHRIPSIFNVYRDRHYMRGFDLHIKAKQFMVIQGLRGNPIDHRNDNSRLPPNFDAAEPTAWKGAPKTVLVPFRICVYPPVFFMFAARVDTCAAVEISAEPILRNCAPPTDATAAIC
jgi:hypothetical protein